MSVMTPATRVMDNSVDSFSFYQNSPRSKSLVQRNNKNLLYKKLDDRIQRNQFGFDNNNDDDNDDQVARSKHLMGRNNGISGNNMQMTSQIDLKNSKREQLLENMKSSVRQLTIYIFC